MLPGGQLKEDWAPFKAKIKPGTKIMLMGTVDEVTVPLAPKVATTFIEDLPQEEQSRVLTGPPGLETLENTCYMNASRQCLNAVPEVRQALNTFAAKNNTDSNTRIVATAKNLFNELNTTHKPVVPLAFVSIFRDAFPNFAEQKNGKYMQQDAEEFWTQLLTCLRVLPKLPNSDHLPGNGAVDQLFSLSFKEEYKCLDNPDEEKTTNVSTASKMTCNIQIQADAKNIAKDVYTALEQTFVETIEKKSPTLDKEAKYQKKAQLNSLPYYLTLQFVRFFWKQTDDKGHKTKISRPLDFPYVLDLYKFCTPELQAKLLPNRKRPEEKKKDTTPTAMDTSSDTPASSSSSSSASSTSPATALSDGPYVNRTGQYELVAVLTHQGMSADGGHYVGWVRQSDDQDDWLEFNDKKVEKRTYADIQKLTGFGGAQWHIAYMCLYKTKIGN